MQGPRPGPPPHRVGALRAAQRVGNRLAALPRVGLVGGHARRVPRRAPRRSSARRSRRRSSRTKCTGKRVHSCGRAGTRAVGPAATRGASTTTRHLPPPGPATLTSDGSPSARVRGVALASACVARAGPWGELTMTHLQIGRKDQPPKLGIGITSGARFPLSGRLSRPSLILFP